MTADADYSAGPQYLRAAGFLSFGQKPFDDVRPGQVLYGRPVASVSESQLMHAAALGVLPEWDRFGSYAMTGGTTNGAAAPYASSALRHLARGLIQLERTRMITSHVPTFEESDELLDLITLAFIHVVGVFDALAAVAAKTLGIQLGQQSIGWQQSKFLAQLRTKCPSLFSLVEERSDGAKTFAAIRAVRNTVHTQMPNPALVSRAGGDPAHDRTKIIFEFGAHGGVIKTLDDAGWSRFVFRAGIHPPELRDKKGVELSGVTRASDMVGMSPESLLLPCFNDGVPLVNAIMRETPIGPPAGAKSAALAAGTLYPISLQLYAVERLGLRHLAKHLEGDSVAG